jgi:hypothetical protein
MSSEVLNEYMLILFNITEKCGEKAKVERIIFKSKKDTDEYISKLNNENIEFYEIQLITTYIKKTKNNVQKEVHKNILSRISLRDSPWVKEWRISLSKK